jgi:hypothetical protein
MSLPLSAGSGALVSIAHISSAAEDFIEAGGRPGLALFGDEEGVQPHAEGDRDADEDDRDVDWGPKRAPALAVRDKAYTLVRTQPLPTATPHRTRHAP